VKRSARFACGLDVPRTEVIVTVNLRILVAKPTRAVQIRVTVATGKADP
jgi:hypothetical protein